MRIKIKNMVCPCCQLYVRGVLKDLSIQHTSIGLGEIVLAAPASPAQLESLDSALRLAGLEILNDFKNMLIEKVKVLLRNLVNNNSDPLKTNISAYLSEQIHYNYSYLSDLFSKIEGMTIREYVISLRIDRVKRMLYYEGLDLLEISCRLNYSSTAHLAAQFKKVTGMTTTEFKRVQIQEAAFLALSA